MKVENAQTLTLSREEVDEAQSMAISLDEVDPKDLRIVVVASDGREIDVPAGMVRFLERALRIAASGGQVGISSIPKVLTSVEAAQMLGISRPTLLKMAKDGEIDSHKVGTHTRFDVDDVRRFISQRADRQSEAFGDLRDFEHSLGLDD